MLDSAALQALVNDHRIAVQEALAALPVANPVQLEALEAVSTVYGVSVADLLAPILQDPVRSNRFTHALRKRGIPVGVTVPAKLAQSNADPAELADFVARASTFRCLILVNGDPQGSGCILSPNLVVTAWHVISGATSNPEKAKIEVRFTDETSAKVRLPERFSSECWSGEIEGLLPASDEEASGKNDVALLFLDRPAGPHLGAAPLPTELPTLAKNGSLFLAHYPEGQDHGFGSGSLQPLGNLTVRWGHTMGTRGGSSGGGCFTTQFTLAGLHQGKAADGGRMVPINLFIDDLRPWVEQDSAPDTVWSTDGTAAGQYIIGRQDFFHAFAASVRKEGRIRGLRIKRSDAAADLTGIPFSYAMLEQLVTPRPDMRVARVSFDQVIDDLPKEIVRRAEQAGISGGSVTAGAGVDAGHSAPESVEADKGRQAAEDLDRRAGEQKVKLWIFFEHPSVVFGDEQRSALEGFLERALRLPNLRLVIAGFEAVALPGQEFRSASEADGAGPPGLLVEYLTGFRPHDVEAFLGRAAEAIGYPLPLAAIRQYTRDALFGVEHVNGVYDPWRAGEVASRLRPVIERMSADVAEGLVE